MDPNTLKIIREQVSTAETKLAELEKDIRDAQKAGVDVTALSQTARDQRNRINRLKSVYGI